MTNSTNAQTGSAGEVAANDPRETLKERMDHRLNVWYKNAEPHPVPEMQKRRNFLASLVNKSSMPKYIQAMGIPLPKLYKEVDRIDEIGFEDLPDRLVIKPNNASTSKGVMLFMGDQELMRHEQVPVAERGAFVEKIFAEDKIFERKNTKIVVEELVKDYDPAYDIPRDFKLYVAGGKVHLIRVIDKNDPSNMKVQSYYDRDWNFVDQKVRIDYAMGPRYEKPKHFDQLIEWGEKIAQDLKVFYRVDFFMSPDGPTFGEFTSYPSAGRGYTKFGANLICKIQDLHPDYL